jgi:hypothetical protein
VHKNGTTPSFPDIYHVIVPPVYVHALKIDEIFGDISQYLLLSLHFLDGFEVKIFASLSLKFKAGHSNLKLSGAPRENLNFSKNNQLKSVGLAISMFNNTIDSFLIPSS